ncbi:ArsR/SmtB family transcription factor [Peribacillus sp. SCS-37]|uniref:ArsR/SmtB family transcription factor n=1 Tax=Paraperibacillus esterisolvens TaxID=3115296 RepID=UPI003906443C
MKVIDFTNSSQKTYKVGMAYSLLFECALGIASYTYREIHDSLDKTSCYWLNEDFSPGRDLAEELIKVTQHNTWKSLLLLLLQNNSTDLESFRDTVMNLEDDHFYSQVYPYIGEEGEPIRLRAAKGSEEDIQAYITAARGHAFFPEYIRYVSYTNAEEVKTHLCRIMELWYKEVIQPRESRLQAILEKDYETKVRHNREASPEQAVEKAAMGMKVPQQPGLYKVILIPQITYRPWNLICDLPRTKCIFYPAADRSFQDDEDEYEPDSRMVQTFKLLGDPLRLKILKLAAEREQGLKELQERLVIPKTTLHHHLQQMRAARLILSSDGKYRVNLDAIQNLEGELLDFLRQPEGE